jgi:orotidine-5'-phosphate decarboxylase
VVASPHEISIIRQACGPDFRIVTPGIRAASTLGSDDQARTMSAPDAVSAGASHIVVGRPIIGATDPRAAATAMAAMLPRG